MALTRTQDIKPAGKLDERGLEQKFFERPRRKSRQVRAMAIFGVAAVAVLAMIILGVKLIFFSGGKEAGPGGSSYSAVFLTNGQVYFGHLKDKDSVYPKLTDIYYLRLNQSLHQQKEEEKTVLANSELALIKLGTELHGPIDEMLINREQILFIEILRGDSKVVKAIEEYKKEK